MALFTRIQVAKMCQKTRGQVTTAVQSSRFVLTNDLIDDTIPQNKAVIDSWLMKLEQKKKVAQSSPKSSQPAKVISSQKGESGQESLMTQKLKAEIDYKLEQALNYKLRNAKLRGEHLPTELVLGLFKLVAHHFQVNYKNNAMNILTEIKHKTKMSANDFATYKGRLFNSINKDHRRAVLDSKLGVKKAIMDVRSSVDNQEKKES